ncbi:MAG: polysaccharide deacetylase family protein, partial [Chitinispirillaceae bacterium]|nr:polysaccharide deacetylase family protein [Chitinispirillaceae bacterium]
MLRIDRELTLIFFYFLRTILNRAKNRIPILMYHSISERIEKYVSPYFLTTTTPHVFGIHMQTLKENNYKGISLQEIDKYWDKKEKVVVITFDDGFADFYTNAFPILKEHNFSATVFIPTAYVGSMGTEIFGGIPHYLEDFLNKLNETENLEVAVILPESKSSTIGSGVLEVKN